MRRLIWLILAVVLWPAPALADQPAAVIVVGIPGLRWQDVTVDGTPTLWRLAQTSAVGALSVKAAPSISCPADGFLTLGAGARADAYGAACGTAPTDLAEVERRNRDSREQADVRTLVAGFGPAAVCATGPLARLAVPGATGTGPCALSVLAGPDVAGRGRSRATTAAAADAAVASVDRQRPAGSDLLVVGISGAPGETAAHLQVAIARGPDFPRGTLTSPSTDRRGYVQLVDVAPTILRLRGLAVPPGAAGQPWRVDGRPPALTTLVDLDRRAVAQKAATVPTFVLFLGAQLVGIVGCAVAGRRRGVRLVALLGAAFPGATFLAGLLPWWRAPVPLAALSACVLGFAALLAAPALGRRGRYAPVAVVCALTTAVLVGDLLTGAHLQLTSVTGYSPLVAGRFAGIGNVAFGIYAATGLLTLAAAARRRLWPVLVGGAVLTVVDGAPGWGSDVGGVLALLPAVAVLALLVTGRRLSVLRLSLAGLTAVAVVAVLALADHARPASRRTHLGRFVDQVANGTAGGVLSRKASAVLGLLFHSPVTALLPLVVVAVVVLVRRPPRPLAAAFADEPAYRQALIALSVACALGFALNDSGAAVPALALVVVLPATVALVAGRPVSDDGAASRSG